MQAWLAEQGRGFVRGAVIPIVPGAICFDLSTAATSNGAALRPTAISATRRPPRPRRISRWAASARGSAQPRQFEGRPRLGLGGRPKAASEVAALAVVNALGTVTVGDGPWFWAAPFEIGGEYGGRGLPASFTPDMLKMRLKGGPTATAVENTTLAVVVTDAALTKTQAKRLAVIAQTGFARAIYPVHAPLDGDVVFAAATGERPIDPLVGLTELGMVAANVVARAIARGVYAATALPFPDALPAWQDRFG